MSEGAQNSRLTVLQRLDVATAERLTARLGDELQVEAGPTTVWTPSQQERRDFVRGLLGVRGFRIHPDDIDNILEDRVERYRPEHQEWRLVHGFARAVDALLHDASEGRGPTGWVIAERFRDITTGLARFRNNTMRRDVPWDSIPGVAYPEVGELSSLLDGFHQDAGYGDPHPDFLDLHPARSATRIFWHFARIAPFPDFNLVLAVLATSQHLCAHGYPVWIVQSEDRTRLDALVRSPIPERSVFLEQRLLDTVTGRLGAPNPGS